jgi:hypothetical protein
MTSLIEKISNYKNATQKLIDYIQLYVDLVKRHVPVEFRRELGVVDIFRGEFSYWTAITPSGLPIPTYVSDCGVYSYLYGSFSNRVKFADSKDVLEFAKKLPEYVCRLEAKILELEKSAVSAGDTASAALDAFSKEK